jgi:hypothetical protein
MDDQFEPPSTPPPSYMTIISSPVEPSLTNLSLPDRDGKTPSRAPSPNPGPPTPTRRSSESSTARSEYFDAEADDPSSDSSELYLSSRGHPTKVLDIFHTTYHRNYRIMDSSGAALYYVDNSHFALETPDVTLYAGSEKGGEVLGVAKFSTMFSKHISLGLGDPKHNGGRDMSWFMMERASSALAQNEFKFCIKIHPKDAHARTFAWKRSGKAVVGDGASYSLQNFKCVDGGNGDVVATFANNGVKSWKKKGKFRFVEGVYGAEWERLVLLSGLCLVERVRRRQRAGNSGMGRMA